MSQRILVAAVSRNNNRMLTDAGLHCTRPLLDEIQPTYPAQDLAAAVEVALAVHLERLRVTEALGRPRQCGGTSRGRIYLTWTEISYHISFGTRTRDSQAVVDPFINEPQCSARDSMRRFLHWYRRANGRREGYQLRKTCEIHTGILFNCVSMAFGILILPVIDNILC
ncbi:hypothetical protein EDD17DRAFT_484068 [Pisolithus thermaeus]|nr:hypothetical protein EDD17DRAFT_484068 [Pisolithus thermaeus]